jgi:phospholipid/cholesterol/gamma-HCH transport system substrate-binding protein
MPQRKQIIWAELKVGLLTLVSIVLLVVAIFLVTGRSGFFTKNVVVRTLSPDAGGLRGGAPVRLAGIDVGKVKQVRMSGLEDRAKAVEITMEIDRDYLDQLRTDSEAFLAAEGLLGERYINISKGSQNAGKVPAGATIPFHATAEFSELVGGSRDLIDNLNVLTTQLNTIVGNIEAGKGTIGRLIMEEDLYRRLDATVNAAQKLIADVNSGQGSLARLLSSDELYIHVNATVTKLENFADQLQNGQGTMAKLIHDPSLYQKATDLVSRGTELVNNVNQGKGTLGKLAQDEELYRRLNLATQNLNSILADLQNGRGSMGRLLHDPVLYENLNSTSVEVRELLADFRKNPKKFLTIHFRIF